MASKKSPKKSRPGPPQRHTGTPWIPPGKRYSAGIIGLHEEIEDFYSWAAPQDFEIRMRQDVINRVTNVIHSLYPKALVKCFGSFCTGLYLPSSDIDMVVFGKWAQLPLYSLQEKLVACGVVFGHDVKILDKASVPILKIMDKLTGVRIDISFNMVSGINGASFIEDCIAEFPPLPKIILVLKQFLQHRELNEVFTGGISSYALLLMVISFFQLHPRFSPSDNEDNLGVLLLEFFELYGRNFNYYETAIRVTNRGAYLDKKMVQLTDGQRPSLLCIEDPVQVGHDVGKSSYGIMDVKSAFDYAFAQLSRTVLHCNPSNGSILVKIFKIPESLVEYRRLIQKRYGSSLLHAGQQMS